MILSKKRITKALISLRGCAGWSAPLLLANPEGRFSRVEAHLLIVQKLIQHVITFTVHEDGISEANFFANKRGRKRKGGPSSSGGPAKREDLKKDTPKKEDDKKESSKNDSNKKDEAKKDASKDGAKKEDTKKDAKPKSTEKGKEEERRSSSSYESRSRARRFVITVSQV